MLFLCIIIIIKQRLNAVFRPLQCYSYALVLLSYMRLKAVFNNIQCYSYELLLLQSSLWSIQGHSKKMKCNKSFSINGRERGSHARDVYLTQDTSRMGRARVKLKQIQEEQKTSSMKYGKRAHGHYKGKSPKQGLTGSKNITIELSAGYDSNYH